MPAPYALRPSQPSDSAWIAELRAVVMREDLERLGRWDAVRVRERFLNSFNPCHTFVIKRAGRRAGAIAVRPEPDTQWIEHVYLAPEFQGQGMGGDVLRQVMDEARDDRPFRLNVLQGSSARRLYERHGFVLERQDAVEVFMVASGETSTPAL